MASRPQSELKIGTIIDRTLDVLTRNLVPAMIFIVVITALGALQGLLTLPTPEEQALMQPSDAVRMAGRSLGLGVLVFIAATIASYFFIQALLRNLGILGEDQGMRILGFLGMSALITLGMIGGLILLIIPGLIFAARWSIAPSLFIAQGQKAIQAMGSSWNTTKGNEVSIIVAMIAMSILFYALASCRARRRLRRLSSNLVEWVLRVA